MLSSSSQGAARARWCCIRASWPAQTLSPGCDGCWTGLVRIQPYRNARFKLLATRQLSVLLGTVPFHMWPVGCGVRED
jgi:hypothetical protein